MQAHRSAELEAFLLGLTPGQAIELGDWALVPLLGEHEEAQAELLEEALRAGLAEVAEVDDAGVVGCVRVRHRGDRPLLLLQSEEILGAKQNRMINASFLVAPGTEVLVPVSCVERGRWSNHSPTFRSSGRTVSATMRGQTLNRVASSVTKTQRFDADQGAVWNDVDVMLTSSGRRSSTAAYADSIAHREVEIERRTQRLEPQPGQVGLAAVRGDRLVLLDVLGSSDLYRRGWKTLVRGILADIGVPSRSPLATQVVTRALAAIARMPCTSAPSPGVGMTLHGHGDGFVVGGVTMNGRVFHAVVAPAA
jgi:hypothetical protein